MKKILTIAVITLFTTLAAYAQQKILTVDLGEVYNNFYKAQEAQAKFNSSFENAQEELRALTEEAREMVKEYQELAAKAQNPALTEESRKSYGEQAGAKQQEIMQKETEIQQFRQQTQQTMAMRQQSRRNLLIGEIKDAVSIIAKDKEADIVLNKSELSVLYAIEALDVTREVIEKLNADQPN